MAQKEFQTESKRILELMINSIYTNKDIFLRELISNASDAIDKVYYLTLSNPNLTFNKEDYFIEIKTDKENNRLIISDSGIGMNAEELERNLGIIAKSGSLEFKESIKKDDNADIIGQFGVGFYSAFMVAKKIDVISKKFGEEKAYHWESEGTEGYSISDSEREKSGTDIILTLRDNTDDENYDMYLEEYKIRGIVKTYSNYIRYPIKMEVEKSKSIGEGEDKKREVYKETETLNSMVPIWRKNKSELTDEDYNSYYEERHFGYDTPLRHIHMKLDGMLSFQAILYIPESVPFDFYNREYEKGLELYSSGVLIESKSKELLPDYYAFVKGVVNSEDLSLNISREMLQETRELKLMAKKIEEKIHDELVDMLKNNRENYEKFFENFGRSIKYGLYQSYGMNKSLQDLFLFKSSKESKWTSFKEYADRKLPEQKYIYYAVGKNISAIEKLPQFEQVKDKGYEILYFTEDVDEFAIKVLREFEGMEFKSVASGDLGLDNTEEKEKADKTEKEHEALFKKMKEILGERVKEVKPSASLKNHAVVLSSSGEVSIEMEKILSEIPVNENIAADKILEINPSHPIFNKLEQTMQTDSEKFSKMTEVLYNQARLIAGLPLEDPVLFSDTVAELL